MTKRAVVVLLAMILASFFAAAWAGRSPAAAAPASLDGRAGYQSGYSKCYEHYGAPAVTSDGLTIQWDVSVDFDHGASVVVVFDDNGSPGIDFAQIVSRDFRLQLRDEHGNVIRADHPEVQAFNDISWQKGTHRLEGIMVQRIYDNVAPGTYSLGATFAPGANVVPSGRIIRPIPLPPLTIRIDKYHPWKFSTIGLLKTAAICQPG